VNDSDRTHTRMGKSEHDGCILGSSNRFEKHKSTTRGRTGELAVWQESKDCVNTIFLFDFKI
jgi:hypothetical protein